MWDLPHAPAMLRRTGYRQPAASGSERASCALSQAPPNQALIG